MFYFYRKINIIFCFYAKQNKSMFLTEFCYRKVAMLTKQEFISIPIYKYIYIHECTKK